MNNKINYLKRNRVNITSIFIILFILYDFFTKNYNAALGYIILGIVLNIINIFILKKKNGKESVQTPDTLKNK